MEAAALDRTVSAWIIVYEKIISARPIKPKTLYDKKIWLRCLNAEFGHRLIDDIMPFELAVLAKDVASTGRETAAKRIILEAKDLFNEALLNGWACRNPAYFIRTISPRIKRRRLSQENWSEMHSQTVHGSIRRRLLRLALVSAQRNEDLCAARFDHVLAGHLHVAQQKTGQQVRIPLELRLNALDLSLGDIIEECREAAAGSPYMLPMRSGAQSRPHRLTWLFSECRKRVSIPIDPGQTPPTLHEVRSLAERLYRYQGVDTQALLGHKFPRTTNIYNDDRGLEAREWKTVRLQMPSFRDTMAG